MGLQEPVQKHKWTQRFISKHRLFIIGIFLFSIVAHVLYIPPGGPSACYPNPLFLVIDEGTVLYDSFRITCGEVIYRDFFQFQGPVFYYIYAGLFAFTGPSIAAARVLNLLITALTEVFIALLITQSFGPIIGAGAAVIHACLLVPMYPYVYPHWLAETFAFAGIYLLAKGYGRPSRELAGGVCLGLCTATIQSLGLPILAVCIVALALPGIARHSWKETCVHPLRVFGGALLSIFPFIIYLGLVGALDQMWYATAKWVFRHYSMGQKDATMSGYGTYLTNFIMAHSGLGWPWRGLAVISLRFATLLPVFTICGVIVVTAQIVSNKERRWMDYVYLMISISGIAGTAPLLLGITRPDIVHIAFLGSFGLCGAAVASQALVNWKPHFRSLATIVWVTIGVLVIANFSAKAVMTYRPSREMKGWREKILKQGMASWIDTNLGSNERIVTAYGGLQYLYIRRAAVGFTFLPFDTPLYYSDEQWRKIGDQILKTLPPIIEVTKDQWLQVKQRTPKLNQIYHLVNNHFLMREGFTLRK